METALPTCSITWTVIPCISHMMPFIGHLAVTDSKGMQYDFGMNHEVHKSPVGTIFGPPCRYFKLQLNEEQTLKWDNAIQKVSK